MQEWQEVWEGASAKSKVEKIVSPRAPFLSYFMEEISYTNSPAACSKSKRPELWYPCLSLIAPPQRHRNMWEILIFSS